MYEDEETQEPISCPWCGAIDDACPHLLAVLDRSNASCDGGFAYDMLDEFESILTDVFAPMIKMDQQPPKHWNSEIIDMWDNMEVIGNKEDDETEAAIDISFDSYSLLNLVSALFDEVDAESYNNSQLEECMPGQDWAVDLVYAKDPAATFDKCLEVLHDWLSPGKLPK
jgi:hypothetical protein